MFWKGSVDSALIKHSTLQPSSFCHMRIGNMRNKHWFPQKFLLLRNLYSVNQNAKTFLPDYKLPLDFFRE